MTTEQKQKLYMKAERYLRRLESLRIKDEKVLQM